MTSTPLPQPGALRRAFVDIPAGQVHLRRAGEAAPGSTPLVCLHQSPFSSLTYAEILPLLGQGRVAVALDTPGFGESFRPTARPSIRDYADGLRQAITALGFEQFDLLGLFTGAAIASQMAVDAPDAVRRLVLCGPPVFTAEERARFLATAWPPRPREDGSHLLEEWTRVMTRALPDVPFARRCDAFHELYRGGGDALWGEMAVSEYVLADTLPRIQQPTLILQPDGVYGDGAQAAAAIPRGAFERLEGVRGWSMMQSAPTQVAEAANRFLALDEAVILARHSLI